MVRKRQGDPGRYPGNYVILLDSSKVRKERLIITNIQESNGDVAL